jgi:hypothetical protein
MINCTKNGLGILMLALALLFSSVALGQEGPEPTDAEPIDDAAKTPPSEAGETKTTGERAGEGAAGGPDADAADGAQSGDSVTYDLRVRELEEKVNDLKEKIFRSKSRLVLLKETVLRGSISGSKAVLIHSNEMGNSFKLEQAIYSLDGNQIYNKVDADGDLADKERFEIFNGAIVPGNHNISVMLVYRGNGFGVFSYLQGYKFTIRSSYTFAAEEGKTTRVKVIGYEKGNVTTALEDRPDIRYEIEFVDDSKEISSKTTK